MTTNATFKGTPMSAYTLELMEPWYKKLWRNHKGKIIAGGVAIAAIAGYAIYKKFYSETSVADDISAVITKFSNTFDNIGDIVESITDGRDRDWDIDVDSYSTVGEIKEYISECFDMIEKLKDVMDKLGDYLDMSLVEKAIEALEDKIEEAQELLQ